MPRNVVDRSSPPPLLANSNTAFSLEADPKDADILRLVVSPPGARFGRTVLWSRAFADPEGRRAIFDAITEDALDLTFLGHLATSFGAHDLDVIVDRIVDEARDDRERAAKKAAEVTRRHLTIDLVAIRTKFGYVLGLKRQSQDTCEWSAMYNSSVGRDRLWDWLRWQQARFTMFLSVAVEHGDEALTRQLTAEMFSTEKQMKAEGRTVVGSRPLRMWRGE